MKKLLLATLLIFSTSSLLAENIKKTTNSDKTKSVGNDDFFAKFMTMKQKTVEKEEKLKATKELGKSLDNLEKTVDKLSNTLGVDK